MRIAVRSALAATFVLAACSSKASAPPATPTPAPAASTNRPAETGPLTEEEFKALHAPPKEGKVELHGQTIDLDGTKAYLSIPAGEGPFPAIVVIHEWWGLNENVEHWADRLASAGWAALAIDLYGGTVATTRDEAMAAMKSVDKAKASQTITNAIELLGKDPRIAAKTRAVIGWCFGGGWAMQTALDHPELQGAIIYYGQLETDPKELSKIKASVLGIFGNKDKGIPPATVDKFEAGLKEAGVKAEIHRYDAEHAFANPSNPIYDESSAADAWSHVLAFLDSLKK